MTEGASLEGRHVDPKIAPAMLRLHALLLGSKQRLLQHSLRRASSAEPVQRTLLQARAAKLEGDLERLHASRLQWALLAPPSYPEYWVASYDSLVTLTEELLQEMLSDLPQLTERTRRELMTRDIPELRQQLLRYRSELRRWTKARLRATLTVGRVDPAASGPRTPFPVVDGLDTAGP
jgi:hypothetical protein